jgi:hypothetical protein
MDENGMRALATAHAVLETVRHVLNVSTDLPDARRQLEELFQLVRDKAQEEQVPAQMLIDEGRDLLKSLL